jgi:hypothetical protein
MLDCRHSAYKNYILAHVVTCQRVNPLFHLPFSGICPRFLTRYGSCTGTSTSNRVLGVGSWEYRQKDCLYYGNAVPYKFLFFPVPGTLYLVLVVRVPVTGVPVQYRVVERSIPYGDNSLCTHLGCKILLNAQSSLSTHFSLISSLFIIRPLNQITQ